MIAALRVRHRRASAALGALAPAVLVLAIVARTPIPSDPSGGALDAGPELPEGSDRRLSWSDEALALRVRDPASGAAPVLELAPRRALEAPDVLVYWSPGAVERLDVPPPEASFVGTLAGARRRTFALPALARERPGTVVLYSLGHRRVVLSADLAPRAPATEVER